jgi:hypothetical protein
MARFLSAMVSDYQLKLLAWVVLDLMRNTFQYLVVVFTGWILLTYYSRFCIFDPSRSKFLLLNPDYRMDNRSFCL